MTLYRQYFSYDHVLWFVHVKFCNDGVFVLQTQSISTTQNQRQTWNRQNDNDNGKYRLVVLVLSIFNEGAYLT